MDKAAALERYRALPVPSTTEEAWRFTDLRGFDPDGFSNDGDVLGEPASIVEIDVAGSVIVGEKGMYIGDVPEGVTIEPLREDHPLLGTLVGIDEKFAAHNAAMLANGILVHVERGVELERPIYIRLQNTIEGGSLF